MNIEIDLRIKNLQLQRQLDSKRHGEEVIQEAVDDLKTQKNNHTPIIEQISDDIAVLKECLQHIQLGCSIIGDKNIQTVAFKVSDYVDDLEYSIMDRYNEEL